MDAETRRGVLSAATRQVTLRQGFKGATLREVAREARWSIGTLFTLFVVPAFYVLLAQRRRHTPPITAGAG